MVFPNDGKCRMPMQSSPGDAVYYKPYDIYDYPSIGQIAELLRKNDIVPIFTVTGKVREMYNVRSHCMTVNFMWCYTIAIV